MDFSLWSEEAQNAYAAGIIDGEGSIGLRSNPSFAVQVQLGQAIKGKCLIDLVVKHFSACQGKPRFQKGRENRQQMIHAFWVGGRSLPFLRRIQPYLVFKSAQAALAISFQAAVNNSRGRSNKSEWAWEQYKLMRFLNRKGHADNVNTVDPPATYPSLFDRLVERSSTEEP